MRAAKLARSCAKSWYAPRTLQRWIGFGVAALAAVGIVVLFMTSRAPAEPPAPKAAPSAAMVAASASVAAAPAPAVEAPTSSVERDVKFDKMPDGTPVPPLPSTAPRSVSFGVILFTYKGAEYAPKDAVSKEQALQKARAAVKEAQANFAEAVKLGDRGSVADAGRLPQGVLERSLEYTLFTLGKGAVHPEPLDTPKGYWVIRRID